MFYFSKIYHFICRCKWTYQRFRRGYSDDDTWRMNEIIGENVLRLLQDFKHLPRKSFPILPTKDALTKSGKVDNKKLRAEWERTLDDMIEGWYNLTYWDSVENKIAKKWGIDGWTDKKWDKYLQESDKKYKQAKRKADLLIKHFKVITNE